jgi:hypothetical protein
MAPISLRELAAQRVEGARWREGIKGEGPRRARFKNKDFRKNTPDRAARDKPSVLFAHKEEKR